MQINAAIFGASGFVGAELLRIVAQHPAIRAARLFGDSQAGQPLSAVHPHLALAFPDARVDRYAPDALDGIDLALLALPHGTSQRVVPELFARGMAVVDLGADFRLDDAGAYEQWYGEPHQAPELLGRFVYGIPELNRARIRNARAVAAAGCYPTAAILALKPLVDAGLVRAEALIVDAYSGVSGAGKALKEATHFNSVAEALSPYGLLTHRHTAEMEMALDANVQFTPHLAPVNRGILATCYGELPMSGPVARPEDPLEPLRMLEAAYADEPFIHVTEQMPSTKWSLGSNAAFVTARYDRRTDRVIAIAALDNLVKGAAGQMIQCANLMFGLDETAGLPRVGVYP